MLILFQFNFHIGDFFIFMHGLLIEFIGGFLILL